MADSVTLVRPVQFDGSRAGAVELAGRSQAISRVQELVRRTADGSGGVLLMAERGIDSASVARDLHARAYPLDRPFVQIDCAARDAASLERELFGVPPGISPPDLEALASDSRLAAARGGTLFLHEVGELPSGLQARLARVMRDREAFIDGAPVAVGFRPVASAAPGFDDDVHARRFRTDLYRRLAATRIDLPALRDRPEDVPALAARVLDDLSGVAGAPRRRFTQTALALLGALSWPGNLAELRAAIERAARLSGDDSIQVEHLLPALQLDRAPAPFVPAGNLREARLKFERDYIASVLQHCGWRMAEAAQALGMQRPNLYRKARQLGIPVVRISEPLS
ncbi:MAG: sigma-54-dependent Fis family transcriptional regulator [Acidobacteria bacterium]|nr:sigma-54-dependent Fis family transcriptional regulator [Acidobacteriota bacterium]